MFTQFTLQPGRSGRSDLRHDVSAGGHRRWHRTKMREYSGHVLGTHGHALERLNSALDRFAPKIQVAIITFVVTQQLLHFEVHAWGCFLLRMFLLRLHLQRQNRNGRTRFGRRHPRRSWEISPSAQVVLHANLSGRVAVSPLPLTQSPLLLFGMPNMWP